MEQWGRMGRGLDDYQGAINRKKTTQKHVNLIRIFTDRSVPAIGTFGHRSRGRGALAWGPHSTRPPAAAFTEHQARARVRRSRTRIALAPPDTI
jgi:hypothetical protein